ncbi:type II and III secretion system protein [Massilia sp. H-1]|nr:type II and III secretion system protein [Massilia sp. H-1]
MDADNTITAKLSTELSQIDPAVNVQGIPGFITRNTSTELSIKPGEVVALSGLVNSELSNAIDRVPKHCRAFPCSGACSVRTTSAPRRPRWWCSWKRKSSRLEAMAWPSS